MPRIRPTFAVFFVTLVTLLCAVSVASETKIDPAEAKTQAAAIVKQIEELRGLKFKQPVPVEVIDDDRAREYMLARLDRFGIRSQMNVTGEAYRMLGLLPEGVDLVESMLDVMRDQAGGFYDPDRKTFYLLDDMPPILAPMIIAHELTHALEDQHFDLDGRLKKALADDDRLFAIGAVHEGSAMVVMTQFTARQLMTGKTTPADLAAQAEAQAGQQEMLKGLPQVLTRQLLGPYLLGASFLTRGNLMQAATGGYPVEDAARAFASGPVSSEQVLHPEKFWDPGQRDDPREVSLSGTGEALGKRWKLAAEGVLGELVLGVLVGAEVPSEAQTMLGGSAAWTNQAAAGWGGDRWQLWKRGNKAVALAVIEWDSETDAGEFVEALPEDRGFEVISQGTRVVLVAGDAGKKRAALVKALTGPAGGRSR